MLQKSDLEDDIAAYIAERLPQAEMKVLFDVGANVGWFTTQFLKAYADCECYLFEPVTANFEEIRTTLGRFPETNPFPRTKCFRVAMGLTAEQSRVTAVPGVTVNKIVGDRPSLEPVEDVDIITGDAFCAEQQIDRISFLKIDTEGYDLKVLLGFAGMLSQERVDFVQVEAGLILGNELHVPIAVFEAILNSFGYRLFRYTNQASRSVPILTWADVVFINERTAHALAAKSHLVSRAAAPADRVEPSRGEFEAQVAAARQAMDAQEWERAAGLWSAIVAAFPADAAAFTGKAAALRELGRLGEAEAVLAQAMQEFPLDLWTAAEHAAIAMRRRDWGEALRRWEEVQRRFPNHPVSYSGRGEALRDAGRIEEAEAVFADALHRFPENAWLATHHAAVASSRRDWPNALRRWQDLASRFPDHAPAYTGKAEALRESGHAEEGDRLLTEAIERFPDNEWVAITWARGAMERQDWDGALQRWDVVLERFPNNTHAHTGKAEAQTAASARDNAGGSGGRARPRLDRRSFSAGNTKFSAYLSVYNDWDILEPALRSMQPFVDELVVVDGGYRWMAGFLDATGRNPEKSDPRVYQAIEAAGIPFRVISRMWDSELEKRLAGYMACQNRFIYRIDADEILHFDENLDAFLHAGAAVAQMEMPLYVAPGWIVGWRDRAQIERQSFLFDSKQVSAEAHLNYLWLVLSLEQLPSVADRPPVFPAPIAFNAHLSLWRTPTTSMNRTAFYSLNHIRAHGLPWNAELSSQPLPDLTKLFEHIPPKAFLETLFSNDDMLGYPFRGDDWILKASPLGRDDEAKFSRLYDALLSSLVQTNADFAVSGRYIFDELKVDLSSTAAIEPLLGSSGLGFQFSADLANAEVFLDYILPSEPWKLREPAKFEVEKNRLIVKLPPEASGQTDHLRRLLAMNLWFEGGGRLQRVSCI
jgi:FkbM family methyltransferase